MTTDDEAFEQERTTFEDAFGEDPTALEEDVLFEGTPPYRVDAATRSIVAADGTITQIGDPAHPETPRT